MGQWLAAWQRGQHPRVPGQAALDHGSPADAAGSPAPCAEEAARCGHDRRAGGSGSGRLGVADLSFAQQGLSFAA
eukprot:8770807-Heterocapsa_arctica.AAC.1